MQDNCFLTSVKHFNTVVVLFLLSGASEITTHYRLFILTVNLYNLRSYPCNMPPTVDSEPDGYALHAADGILHCAGVNVIIWHQNAWNGQHLLVMWKQQARVIGQQLASLQPTVDGLCAIIMGTVEVEVLAVLQHRRGHHLDVRFGHRNWWWQIKEASQRRSPTLWIIYLCYEKVNFSITVQSRC